MKTRGNRISLVRVLKRTAVYFPEIQLVNVDVFQYPHLDSAWYVSLKWSLDRCILLVSIFDKIEWERASGGRAKCEERLQASIDRGK